MNWYASATRSPSSSSVSNPSRCSLHRPFTRMRAYGRVRSPSGVARQSPGSDAGSGGRAHPSVAVVPAGRREQEVATAVLLEEGVQERPQRLPRESELEAGRGEARPDVAGRADRHLGSAFLPVTGWRSPSPTAGSRVARTSRLTAPRTWRSPRTGSGGPAPRRRVGYRCRARAGLPSALARA
jgi:hypothetical protein